MSSEIQKYKSHNFLGEFIKLNRITVLGYLL